VDGFWMDETDVTNAQFREFVEVTGYVTTAEKPEGRFIPVPPVLLLALPSQRAARLHPRHRDVAVGFRCVKSRDS
jgi:formylglycine-generating enzyme required for sulfatase activity